MNYLFICNGNVARSQEAEYFFNDLSEDDIATSAGVNVEVGKPIDPLVLQVMQEADYGMLGAHRKMVTETMVSKAYKIISFKPLAELPDYLQKRANDLEIWDVPDPRHQSLEFHRKIRDDIQQRVERLVRES